MTVRRAINLYLYAIREWADERRMLEIEAALEAPNVVDPVTRRPKWWTSDEDAWDEWAESARR